MVLVSKVYDKVGQEITKGCFIAYGHALGRCAGLRVGRVESVNIQEKTQYDWEKKKDIPYDEISVTVLGIDDDWDEKPHLLEKKSTLFFPERMIVLYSVPEKFTKLYETDCVALGGKHKWVKYNHYYKYCPVCHFKEKDYKEHVKWCEANGKDIT